METAAHQPTGALAQVRATLHQAVEEINDLTLLEALAVMLRAAQPSAPVVDGPVRLADLSPAERAAVEEGLHQLDTGQGIPHAQVWAKYAAAYDVASSVV